MTVLYQKLENTNQINLTNTRENLTFKNNLISK